MWCGALFIETGLSTTGYHLRWPHYSITRCWFRLTTAHIICTSSTCAAACSFPYKPEIQFSLLDSF